MSRRAYTGTWGGISRDRTIDKDGIPMRIVSFRLTCAGELVLCVAFKDAAEKVASLEFQAGETLSVEGSHKPGSGEFTVWEVFPNKARTITATVEEPTFDDTFFTDWNERQGILMVPLLVGKRHIMVRRRKHECFEHNGKWISKHEFVMDQWGAKEVGERTKDAENNRPLFEKIVDELWNLAISKQTYTPIVTVDDGFDWENTEC